MKLCDGLSIPHGHPPPGADNKCPVIERKVNAALAGLRAYLATAVLPNCFWPPVGRCSAFNDTLDTRGGTRKAPYDVITGKKFKGMKFVTGELGFFKPAKTIMEQPKTYLRPGVFLHYYSSGGKWNGQYVVADLEDIANENLYHLIGAKHSSLHMHRTEVVKKPWDYVTNLCFLCDALFQGQLFCGRIGGSKQGRDSRMRS